MARNPRGIRYTCRMSAFLLALLLVAQPVMTPSSGTPAPAPAATTPTPETTTTVAPETATAATTTAPPSLRGPVGVGLLAAGAGLAAGGTVAFTFVEAVSTPDRASNPASAASERFTAISGFLGVAIASVSAVLMVIGAGLTLSESGDGAVAPR